MAGTTAEDWDITFAVNLRGHFLVAREALPHLAGDGAFVFISSVAGLTPGSRLPAYDASKAGLLGLCRHVALEGARQGVRANVVAPGLIDTPHGPVGVTGPAVARPHPGPARSPGLGVGRRCRDRVPAVARGGYMTGQVLAVDGGLTLL